MTFIFITYLREKSRGKIRDTRGESKIKAENNLVGSCVVSLIMALTKKNFQLILYCYFVLLRTVKLIYE